MSVQVEQHRNLDAVAADAGDALSRDAQPVLFDRLDWFRMTDHIISGPPPLVLRARLGSASAWLFLRAARHQAEPLGSWYTLAYAPIFSGQPPDDVKAALLAAILQHLRGMYSRLTLQPLHAALADLVKSALRQAGWRSRAAETGGNWVIDTAGLDWPAYWAGRPSRLRNTVAQRRKRSSLVATISQAFDPAAWHAYEQVFAASWKPHEGSMPFLRALAEQEAAAGTLRLGVGRFDDKPVAAQLWLVENGVATIHKLAHVIAHDARSPGTQLSAAMFEHVLTHDAPRLIDYGTGDDPYKQDWTDQRRPLFTIEAADPRRPAGLARLLRWKLARLARPRSAG